VILIAVIPARGGSKRLPNKNVLEINGSPILGLTIQSLLSSECISEVFVTTDSKEIRDISLSFGAKVPFLRSAELSNDTTTTLPVIRDALDRLKIEEDQDVLVSYPTAMLSSFVIDQFTSSNFAHDGFLVTIGKLRPPPARLLREISPSVFQMVDASALDERTQDLPQGYFDAGKLYLARASTWRSSNNALAHKFNGYLLNEQDSIDIDTLEDWEYFKKLKSVDL
jgi:N-acylneuraminate cytidylyltransferase